MSPNEKAAAAKKPASAPAKTDDAQTANVLPGSLLTVVTRNEFYRDGFRNMVRVAIVQTIIILGLIAAILFYMTAVQPTERYFATTADGRIMKLVPLDQPDMNTSALLSWAAQAATETLTFGFHDYQRRLQQSSRHFTKRGWDTFAQALQKSRIIDDVKGNQQVVTSEPRSAPVLLQQGVINGKYRWMVRMPLRVTYKSAGKTRTDNMMVNLVIERVPSLENPDGVGIEQWIATAE